MTDQKSAWIISFGIIIAACVFGLFFYSSRIPDRTIRVVGYATQDFEADIVKWSFNLSVPVPLNGLNDGYRQMKNKLDTFQKIWDLKKIEVDEFQVRPVSVQKSYGEYGKISGYTIEQNIYIISKNINAIEKITINPVDFAKMNLAFEYSRIEYFSSQLEDIKKQLLSYATKNARERAEEIVAMTESAKIGKMLSARAGIFQITEPLSTDIAGYGIHSTSTRNKTIKVTVNAVFSID
jgi:hypothetical protein